MTVLKNGDWEYQNDGGKVKKPLVDNAQPEGCVQFAYKKSNGKVSSELPKEIRDASA